MCFLFSSIPRIKTGHMSIMVCAGMCFVANTPRPAYCVSYLEPLVCLRERTFWCINLDDHMWTSLKWNIV
jgi:hypothetical protein